MHCSKHRHDIKNDVSHVTTGQGATAQIAGLRRLPLRVTVALIITFGILLRFYHADYKAFSDDEAVTVMHILGLTESEAVVQAVNFKHVLDLLSAVHPSTGLRPVSATIETLRIEDPQHPPVYYVLGRWWASLFGDSRQAFRMLSASISVLALPAMFWLCMELFGSAAAAWVGVALLAVSPVDVLYAQEVREYGLWLAALLAASAMFVRALRTGSRRLWVLYAVALAISLYTYPMSAFVAMAHAVVAALAKIPWTRRLCAIGAISAGCLLFAPWLMVIAAGIDQINKGMAVINHAASTPFGVLRTFLALLRVDVLDLNGAMDRLKWAAGIPIVGFIGYALYELRRSDPLGRLFAWSLVACATLPLVLPDLLFGGQRTAITRYFLPLFVAIDLALASLASETILSELTLPAARRNWLIAFALIFSAKIGSCALSSQAHTWWTKANMRSFAVAATLNHAPNALLISDNYIVWAIALSEYLDPHMAVALKPRCYLCASRSTGEIDLRGLSSSGGIGTAFLLGPSAALQSKVKAIIDVERHPPAYECIDIRNNCAGGLSLF